MVAILPIIGIVLTVHNLLTGTPQRYVPVQTKALYKSLDKFIVYFDADNCADYLTGEYVNCPNVVDRSTYLDYESYHDRTMCIHKDQVCPLITTPLYCGNVTTGYMVNSTVIQTGNFRDECFSTPYFNKTIYYNVDRLENYIEEEDCINKQVICDKVKYSNNTMENDIVAYGLWLGKKLTIWK